MCDEDSTSTESGSVAHGFLPGRRATICGLVAGGTVSFCATKSHSSTAGFIDPRGHGRSEHTTRGFKTQRFAEDIVERLHAVSASTNVLVIDHAEMPSSN